MSKVTVESSGTNYRFEINARTHAATVDATAALKGGDTAMTPHEAFWGGLAACTGMTIAMYANRKGWDLTKVHIEIDDDQVDDPDTKAGDTPVKILRLTETITLEGNLTDAQVSELEGVAKKCPVYKEYMGKKVVETKVSCTKPASATTTTGSATTAIAQADGDPGTDD